MNRQKGALKRFLTHGIFGFRPLDVSLAAVHICEVCHKPFPTLFAVRQHLRTCLKAGRQLEVRVQRLTVEQVSTQLSSTDVSAPVTQELYLCSHRGCQIIFPTAVQLEFHMQVHKDKRAFLCGNCGKCCLNREELADHVKSHIPIKPLRPVECKMCGKKFANRARNLQHMSRHVTNISGVVKCAAIKCNQTFSSVEKLKLHARKHMTWHKTTENSVHVCQHCGQELKTLHHFRKHVRSHSLKMPGYLNCVHWGCNNLYKESADLLEHSAKHEKRRDCVECGKRCTNLQGLEQHMLKHRKKAAANKKPVPNSKSPIPCDECGKFYASMSSLNDHKKRHTQERQFFCDVPGCSYAGKVINDLQCHKRYVHDIASSECHLCGKIIKNSKNVSLKGHLQRHETGTEGLLKCVSHRGCKQTFTCAEDLRKHALISRRGKNQKIDLVTLDCDYAFESEQSLDLFSSGTWTTTSSNTANQDPLEETLDQSIKIEVEEVFLD